MNNVDLKSADLSSSPKAEVIYVDLVRNHPHPTSTRHAPLTGKDVRSVDEWGAEETGELLT